MTDYIEQTPEELERLEAIAHAEGRTTEAALLDALAQVMRERDSLQIELEEAQSDSLSSWENTNGPADEYVRFFEDCFEHLNGHYPCPSVTSDYDKSVIFDAIRKGEQSCEFSRHTDS